MCICSESIQATSTMVRMHTHLRIVVMSRKEGWQISFRSEEIQFQIYLQYSLLKTSTFHLFS